MSVKRYRYKYADIVVVIFAKIASVSYNFEMDVNAFSGEQVYIWLTEKLRVDIASRAIAIREAPGAALPRHRNGSKSVQKSINVRK